MKKLLSKISLAVFIALVMLLVITFALPCVPAQAANTPECWALIVGSSPTYTDQDTEAEDLEALLSPVWGSSHINLVIGSQATKAGIMNGISWIVNNAGADDTVFCFFTSHHYGIDNVSRLGVLLAYDFPQTVWDDTKVITSTALQTAFISLQSSKVYFAINAGAAARFGNLAADGRIILMSCDSDSSPILYWAKTFVSGFTSFDTTDTNHDYELSVEETANRMTNSVVSDRYSGELPLLAKFAFATNTNLPSGTNILTLDGVNYTSAPSPQLWIPGSTHTMTVPQVVNAGSGTRYVFTGWNDGSIATTRTVSKGSFTPNYDKEYQLSVNSAYGSTAGAGWYKDGLTANFSVTASIELSDTKHYFTGWSGDFSGTTASASLVMNAPRTVTANWRHEYLLSVDSAYGTPAGAGWYKDGLSATFSVTPSIELTDTKHYFTNWSGDFSGTTASASLIMSGPKKVTANWRHEYLLKINSEYGQPTGAGWYKEGERANISVEPTQGFIIRHIFTGWSGDLSDTQSSIGVSMTSPKVITATWQTDFIQLYILIGIVVVLAGAIITTVVIVRGRGATPPAPPAGTPPQYTPPPAPPQYTPPAAPPQYTPPAAPPQYTPPPAPPAAPPQYTPPPAPPPAPPPP
jgi:hypothetical protein